MTGEQRSGMDDPVRAARDLAKGLTYEIGRYHSDAEHVDARYRRAASLLTLLADRLNAAKECAIAGDMAGVVRCIDAAIEGPGGQ